MVIAQASRDSRFGVAVPFPGLQGLLEDTAQAWVTDRRNVLPVPVPISLASAQQRCCLDATERVVG
jgi:hypothetical protein